MSWPTPQEYNEAIQTPGLCFVDEALKHGAVETTPMGLPRSMTGAFASVYRVNTQSGDWAVRCFLTQPLSQRERYERISEFVLFDDLECTVDFYYLDKGIRVKGSWYPILKMKWIAGENLDQYVLHNYTNKSRMQKLLDDFYDLAVELDRAGIAHGDLQHGNIIVSSDGLRLVDYDALYVPALKGKLSLELGHPNYQHPERDECHYDPTVDNFSIWLIHASLRALLIDPSLLESLNGGDECILLRRGDLRKPEESSTFKHLLHHESEVIRNDMHLLLRMLWALPSAVPPISADESLLDLLPRAAYTSSKTIQSEANVDTQDKPEHIDLPSARRRFDSTIESESRSGILRLPAKLLKASSINLKVEFTKATSSIKSTTSDALKTINPLFWTRWKTSAGDKEFQEGKYEEAAEHFTEVYHYLESINRGTSGEVLRVLDLAYKLGATLGLMNNSQIGQNYYVHALQMLQNYASTRSHSPDLRRETARAKFMLSLMRNLQSEPAIFIVEAEKIASLEEWLPWIIEREIPNRLILDPRVFDLLVSLGSKQISMKLYHRAQRTLKAAERIYAELRSGASHELTRKAAQLEIRIGLLLIIDYKLGEAKARFNSAFNLIGSLPDASDLALEAALLSASTTARMGFPDNAINYLQNYFASCPLDVLKALSFKEDVVLFCDVLLNCLEGTARRLESEGELERSKLVLGIRWRVLCLEQQIFSSKLVDWLEQQDEEVIRICLESSMNEDKQKGNLFAAKLTLTAIGTRAFKTLSIFVEILERDEGRRSHTNELVARVCENCSTSELLVIIDYAVRNNCTSFLSEFSKEPAYSNMLEALVELANRSEESSGQDSKEDKDSSKDPLTHFDTLVNMLISSISTRNPVLVERLVQDLTRQSRGPLVSSAMRLAYAGHVKPAAVMFKSMAHQGYYWSLEKIAKDFVGSNRGELLEEMVAALSTELNDLMVLKFAERIIKESNVSVFKHVARAISSTRDQPLINDFVELVGRFGKQEQVEAIEEILAQNRE